MQNQPRPGLTPLMQAMMQALPRQSPRPLPELVPGMPEDAAPEASIMIEHKPGGVRLVFPRPVAWIGFTPEQALEIAEGLKKHAALASEVPEESRIITAP